MWKLSFIIFLVIFLFTVIFPIQGYDYKCHKSTHKKLQCFLKLDSFNEEEVLKVFKIFCSPETFSLLKQLYTHQKYYRSFCNTLNYNLKILDMGVVNDICKNFGLKCLDPTYVSLTWSYSKYLKLRIKNNVRGLAKKLATLKQWCSRDVYLSNIWKKKCREEENKKLILKEKEKEKEKNKKRKFWKSKDYKKKSRGRKDSDKEILIEEIY